MSTFRFKQFAVQQDQCAMKIGTDGVLLGAWAGVNHQPQSILDVGAGTGVIALMMAQRSTAALIDALELDDNAFQQCVHNFENSPWGDRLFCYHADFKEFVAEMDESYDLIISNPPFFTPSQTQALLSEERQKAQFSDSLPFELLLDGAEKLLADNGQFAVVLPYQYHREFVQLAATKKLYVNREMQVRGNLEAPLKRSFLQFGRDKVAAVDCRELVIETERHHYTDEYIELTRDFYLKM